MVASPAGVELLSEITFLHVFSQISAFFVPSTMPPPRSKRLTEKAKAAQDAEVLKKEPKVRRGPGRPRKNDEAPATPKGPKRKPSPRKKNKGKGPSKKVFVAF